MASQHPQIPVSTGREYVQVYGKKFAHSPPGADDYRDSKQDATRSAEEFGLEVQGAMKQRAGGRELTDRERLFGKLEKPPVPNGFQSATPDNGPAGNPYTKMLIDSANRPGHTPAERAQTERQRLRWSRQEAEWNDRKAAEDALQTHDQDSEVVRLRAHALEKYEQARLNPAVSQETLDQLERNLRLAESDTVTPSLYWTEAHGRHPDADAALNKAVLGDGVGDVQQP